MTHLEDRVLASRFGRYGAYDGKERFASYWHQKDEILALRPRTLLHCGIGNNFLCRYLEGTGIRQFTLDNEPDFRPSVSASVVKLPFLDGSFDAIACFQVLEHLPYELFSGILREYRRVSRRHVVLSLPNRSLWLGLRLTFYPRLSVQRGLSIEAFSRAHVFDGKHHWEIGKKGFPVRRIVGDIQAAGLVVRKAYRIPEKPLHHVFVLEKG
ncbi:MAG: methyltransferase domain-containing protein [Planctomycetes bacterium]|nr:methyltransferase domain-containing protein [Planctomycetota bacterium]